MRIHALLAAAALLGLSACGGTADADTDGNGTVSAEELQTASARVTPLEPGQYATTMELVDMVDPSLSAEEITQAKAFMGQMAKMAPPRCLEQDSARNSMIGIAESMQNGDCTVSKLTSDKGGMQAEMSCKTGAKPAQVTLDGVSTGTSSQMTMTVVEPGAAQGQDKRMVMKIAMNRLGDCPA